MEQFNICMFVGDAVVNVYINQEKKFAFVEMRTVEEASNAMALDGIIFEACFSNLSPSSSLSLSLIYFWLWTILTIFFSSTLHPNIFLLKLLSCLNSHLMPLLWGRKCMMIQWPNVGIDLCAFSIRDRERRPIYISFELLYEEVKALHLTGFSFYHKSH